MPPRTRHGATACLLLLLSGTCRGEILPTDNATAVTVNASAGTPFRHFWQSCGWCPPAPHEAFPRFFLSEDQRQNHAMIGGVPRGGIRYVRIHYLLDLIGVLNQSAAGASRNAGGARAAAQHRDSRGQAALQTFHSGHLAGLTFNWTALDLSMDILMDNGLLPTFEIMGNPQPAAFSSFRDPGQLAGWGVMVEALAARYVSRYGLAAVRRWRFESWNEPDGQCHKGLTVGIDCDLPSFVNYFDVTEHALHKVDPQLVFGGPASDGGFTFLWAILLHCTAGKHYVTGEHGCGNVSFWTAHMKGDDDTIGILDRELPVVERVRSITKGTPYADVPFGDDEADPKVGWSGARDWQADVRYSAMAVKAINQHLDAFVLNASLGLPYDILSNDNGFSNYEQPEYYFTQRTLVARFGMNKTNTVETVRKPILMTMGLLALLGDTVHRQVTGLGPTRSDKLGAIVTTRAPAGSAGTGHEFATILYNSPDGTNATGSANVSLQVTGLDPSLVAADAMAMAWHLENGVADPWREWIRQGSPAFPSASQLAALRLQEDASSLPGFPRAVDTATSGGLRSQVPLPLPGVVLLHVCAKPATAPRAVQRVWLHATPTTSPPETLVRWEEPPDRCLQTYSVKYTPAGAANAGAQRVNVRDTIFTTFIHAHNDTAPAGGCYTVTSIDYWGRESPGSAETCLH